MAVIKRYKIRTGPLKGVGLTFRQRRLLKRELKKTVRSYIGRPATVAAQTTISLVRRKCKALSK